METRVKSETEMCGVHGCLPCLWMESQRRVGKTGAELHVESDTRKLNNTPCANNGVDCKT